MMRKERVSSYCKTLWTWVFQKIILPVCFHTSAIAGGKRSRHETAEQEKSIIVREKIFDDYTKSVKNKETFLGNFIFVNNDEFVEVPYLPTMASVEMNLLDLAMCIRI